MLNSFKTTKSAIDKIVRWYSNNFLPRYKCSSASRQPLLPGSVNSWTRELSVPTSSWLCRRVSSQLVNSLSKIFFKVNQMSKCSLFALWKAIRNGCHRYYDGCEYCDQICVAFIYFQLQSIITIHVITRSNQIMMKRQCTHRNPVELTDVNWVCLSRLLLRDLSSRILYHDLWKTIKHLRSAPVRKIQCSMIGQKKLLYGDTAQNFRSG